MVVRLCRKLVRGFVAAMALCAAPAGATPFTTVTPGPDAIALPAEYPAAGGVAMVMVGVNGNIYYQFSDPAGAYQGYQFDGYPVQFRGNPFTINNPIPLDCGVASCGSYFGGGIARMYIRFSAFDGDTEIGGFDENDIYLIMNGVSVGNWTDVQTELTDVNGTQSFGFQQGFGNDSFNTGWFVTTNQTLLNNILAAGSTTTQVYDTDPDDNFWDFRIGQSLSDEALRTIAPGYTFEKTASASAFSAVGEQITYTYTVTNIGSVNINNLQVTDDKIASVTCDKVTINETTGGGTPEVATCTGVYTITQQDYDNQSVTNVASAIGTPEFGSLGAVRDTVTVSGPATLAPALSISKTADRAQFDAPGQSIVYTYEIDNTGDATIFDIDVTDDRIPGLICEIAQLAPQDAPVTCTASYTVVQSDVDAFAVGGLALTNIATASGRDPNGATVSQTVIEEVDGPVAAPAMVVSKSALQRDFAAVGDVLQFEIEVTNTGNVTWPVAPTITDALITDAGGTVSCPTRPVAVGATITCSGRYTVDLADLDAQQVRNEVTAAVTVNGQSASGQADVTVPAIVSPVLRIAKRLPAGAPTTFDAAGTVIAYEYELTNAGNVSLTTPAVSDDKVAVSCPAVTIEPGDSVICTSNGGHEVLQSDLDAGFVTNVASATAETLLGGAVSAGPVSLTVNAVRNPALTIAKRAGPVSPADFVPGTQVSYTYTVTNTGNVTITDPITVSDDRISGPIACGSAPLAPGADRSCVAAYTLTAGDVAVGFVTNRATATAGNIVSNEATETIEQSGAPGIGLTKQPNAANPTFSSLNQSLVFDFIVTNTGDAPIIDSQQITISDPKIQATPFVCAPQPAVLAAGESYTCSATYSGVTQAEIDAGQVVNTARASFTGPTGVITSPSARAVVPGAVTPGMTLVKSAPASFGAVGSTATFTFALTNDSAQTIDSARVSDPAIPDLSCTFSDIAPFATVSCLGDYIVRQADLDAGTITNRATATGTAPTGETLTAEDTATVAADPAAIVRQMTLSKTANVPAFAAVGDEIRYAFAVANTGTVTLRDILVEDPALGLSCTIPVLAPLSTNDTTCRATHVVTQADIDRGNYPNAATATATGVPPASSAITVPGPARTAAFTIEKTPNDATDVVAGQTVTYRHVVTNTGNVTLTDIVLTDSHAASSGTQDLTFAPSDTIASLAPGASLTLTTAYPVTQDDIDAGAALTNTVTGVAVPPAGMIAPTATDDAVVDLQDRAPALSVVKTEADGSGDFGNLPDTETFTFEVFNTGNVTLTGFTLTDGLTGFSCPLPAIAVGDSATTCAGGAPLSSDYTIRQADIDNGGLTNSVTVTDGTLTATDRIALQGPAAVPALSVVKAAAPGAGFAAIGDVVDYTYTITNAGNVTLRGPFTVEDDKATVTCPTAPAAGIAPNGTITCTARYAVTQADLDAGQVTNLATATSQIIPPQGGLSEVSSPQVSETVAGTQSPELSIDKVVTPNTATTFSAIGDVISYDYTITNAGNVTIAAPITIDDDKIGTGLACATADLAPGDSVTCTHGWSAGQGDIDAGFVTNTASPVADFNGSPVPADSDDATVLAVQNPALTLQKAYVATAPDSFAQGSVITYRYTVTNTGNTTITAEPQIRDNRITAAPNTITADAPFPAGGLPPGGTLTYTGLYEITLNDVRVGSVTNQATAASGAVVSNPSSVTTPVDVDPALAVVKSADLTAVDTLNQTVTYTYTVTNTSEGSPVPSFANAILVEDDKIGTITCPTPAGGQLLEDESVTCTASYAVTQADLDAGFVTNVAVASTSFNEPGGAQNVFSPDASVTVPATMGPALTTTKDVVAGDDPAAVGATLTYEIVTRNTGNQTLFNVAIADPMLPDLVCTVGNAPAGAIVTLAPGAALTCRGDHVVTQGDIDAQSLENTATATGSSPQGTPVSSPATDTHPLVSAQPAMLVEKAPSPGEPTGGYSSVGEEVSFTVTVTNAGNVTLTGVTVTDNLVPGETCTIGSIPPGVADDSCVFAYTVTQADIDAGTLTNVATATAQPANPGADPLEVSDSVDVAGPARSPAFALDKVADLAAFDAPGAVITYTYTVANTGNVTLTAPPTVTDDKIAQVACDPFPQGGLRPLQFITCTASYTTTQGDVDAGEVVNIATVGSTEAPFDPARPGNARATETVPATRTPAVTIDKQADDDTDVVAGQLVTYTYTVTNTGNVTLSDLTLADAHSSAAGETALSFVQGATIATLAPGATATRTARYTVTQADLDAGAALTNIVTLTATSPDGAAPTASARESVTVAAEAPAIEAIKTVANSTGSAPGDTVTFRVAVTNTGNVTLSDAALSDSLRRTDGVLIAPAPVATLVSGDGGTLSPGETWSYEVSHLLTQADIDAGGLSNSATATATSPFGTPVSDVSDNGTGAGSAPTPFVIAPAPALEARKVVATPGAAPGDTVTFTIALSNTGNVTLTGVAVASDTLARLDGAPLSLSTGPGFAGADGGSGEGVLKVGETATYTASYVLTQADIDAGGVINTATGTATSPTGAPVTDAVDVPARNPVAAAPAITLDKRLSTGSGPAYRTAGDVLSFDFVVTNTGNVTLTDPVTVADPLIDSAGGTVTCPDADIAPGADLTCTGSYTVTQGDVDAGSLTNAATASLPGVDPAGDTVIVPAIQAPAISVVKQAADLPARDFVTGAVVSYTYTVTNDGNTTLTDPVTVDDNLIETITCAALPAGGLTPGASLSCTGTYTITTDDVLVANVTNIATATSGDTTSQPVSETVPNEGTPALSVAKSVQGVTDAGGTARAGDLFEAVGDIITYAFTVENTGDVAFARDVVVTDPLLGGPLTCWSPDPATDPEFEAGAVATCTAPYTVTQADLDAGTRVNTAVAQTRFGASDTEVSSAPDSATAAGAQNPAIALRKSVDAATYDAVGDVLSYTLEVENTGNQTLTSVGVSDPLLPGLDCGFDSLAPGARETCTGSLVITQADLDAGAVTNTARATAITPSGGQTDADSAPVTSTADADPSALTIVKSATPDPFGAPGSRITYAFAVTNAGPYTMVNLEITDPLVPGYSCAIAAIAPGATDASSCAVSYTVTQGDVDAGAIVNTATVTGETRFGAPSRGETTITTPGPAAQPSLSVVKTADVPATTVGSVVSYRLAVTNTGNVTLTDLSIDDTMTRIGTGAPTFLTTPFGLVSGDTDGDAALDVGEVWIYSATYRITQSDVNAGGVSNTATVTASDPGGTPVSDRSDDGIAGNGDDTPTVVGITTNPVLDVVKSVVQGGTGAGDTVIFEIRAFNRGNVDIFSPVVTDRLTRNDGTDISAGLSAPVLVAPLPRPDRIAPGTSWTYRVDYTLTQQDVDAGGISNLATVSGTDLAGGPVSDISQDDDSGDGNPAVDPTELDIAPAPLLDVTKTLTAGAPVNAGDSVAFTITAANAGNVTVAGVTLSDTLTNLAGDVLQPDGITPDPAVGRDIAPGDSLTWSVTYTLTQADIDAGGIENTATAQGTTPNGAVVADQSDDGDDTDGNTRDDPTQVIVDPVATATLSKQATTPERVQGTVFSTTFTLTVENTGNVTQAEMSLRDDMTVFVAPARLVDVGRPVASGFTAGGASGAYDGVTDTEVLATGTTLRPGDVATVEIPVTFDVAAGAPEGVNVASLTTDRLADPVTASTGLPMVETEPDIFVEKSIVSAGPYQAGSVVSYELRVTNRNSTGESGLTLVDSLPAGLRYVAGSATYNGAQTPAPAVAGRRLEWADVALAPDETVTLRLDALVLEGAGTFVNRAFVTDRSGRTVSNVATASFTIAPEPVFDCGDVIGKVFDDVNGNGYQDPPPDLRAQISDQDYRADGKFGLAPETAQEAPRGEPGIAGVRLVTVRGDIVTTDASGRFHVPCALLPGPTGSNFTLKLDDRSLPTGYRVTTENPRTLRLTPGIMTEMNFGAALGNLVEIDLLAAAFGSGTAMPGAALEAGIDAMVARIVTTPSVIRLTYYRDGESHETARARLGAVVQMIEDKWSGPYRLRIETTIARVN